MEFDQNEFSTIFQFGDDVIELGSTRVKDLINMGYEVCEVADEQKYSPFSQFWYPSLVTFKKGDIILPITVCVYMPFRGFADYFSDGITYSVFLQNENLPDYFSYHEKKLTAMSLNTVKAWSGFTDDVIQDRLERFHYIDIEREHSEVNAYFEADQENISKLEVAISRDVFWTHANEFEESIDFRNSESEASK